MNPAIHLYDVVALLDAVQSKHFENGNPIVLQRGQIGTVVMVYDKAVYEVEFADREGRAYALLPLSADKLMVLHETPSVAAA